MTQELRFGDEEVQKSVRLFLDEARTCAETGQHGRILGFAAMTTIFSCMLAVGEALALRSHRHPGIDASIESFHAEMLDKRSWLLPPGGTTHDDVETCRILGTVRNGLAHSLSMPPDVRLSPNKEAAVSSDKDKWRMIVPDLVDAVDETIAHLREKYPSLPWQRVVGDDRGPVDVFAVAFNTLGISSTGTLSGTGPLK